MGFWGGTDWVWGLECWFKRTRRARARVQTKQADTSANEPGGHDHAQKRTRRARPRAHSNQRARAHSNQRARAETNQATTSTHTETNHKAGLLVLDCYSPRRTIWLNLGVGGKGFGLRCGGFRGVVLGFGRGRKRNAERKDSKQIITARDKPNGTKKRSTRNATAPHDTRRNETTNGPGRTACHEHNGTGRTGTTAQQLVSQGLSLRIWPQAT